MNEQLSIEVLLFARAVELAGKRSLTFEVQTGTTLRQIHDMLVAHAPELIELASVSRWAVGQEFVSQDFQIRESSQIAMIPPVSGG